LNTIDEIITAIGAGEMVVITDDERRENEGDLVMAAELATGEAINFMARYGRGLICAPITAERATELELPIMAATHDRFNTAFTVSVDARDGITTGISADDRSLTARLLADSSASRADLDVPGHLFPLIAKPGGVLERAGHTEAAVDLARLAGCSPAGVICEIMNDDGSMARADDLDAFCEKFELKRGTIADLVAYRQRRENLVTKTGHVKMPVRYAKDEFDLHCYQSLSDGKEHVALVYGEPGPEDALVRVHSECLTGDIFHSARCDCGDQLETALDTIVEAGSGILVYLRQEGRGIGLINKIKAYRLQDKHGLDTVDANVELGFQADHREYSVAARILDDLNISSVRLMTNNPRKVDGLTDCGIAVSERLPISVEPREQNAFYLKTKRDKLGHIL
jgi:3,4-dihydroxy 2-butanone 4-phosphate synthase/GTP cyclohydrolase II